MRGSVTNGRDVQIFLPGLAGSAGAKCTEKWVKTRQSKNIGSKNHWVLWRESQDREGTGAEEVTSCSILPPFTFVNVQEIGWENTRVAAACPDPNRAGRVKRVEGEG